MSSVIPNVDEVSSYRVLYAKSGAKKRKMFADGLLHIRSSIGNSFLVTLVGDDGSDLKKSTERNIKWKIGDEISFGAFVVQLEDKVVSNNSADSTACPSIAQLQAKKPNQEFPKPMSRQFVTPSINSSTSVSKFGLGSNIQKPKPFHAVPTLPVFPPKQTPTLSSNNGNNEDDDDAGWERGTVTTNTIALQNESCESQFMPAPMPFAASSTTKPSAIASASSSSPLVELDPSLVRVMRPHQIVGANFLIARLTNSGGNNDTSENNDDSDADYLGIQDGECTGAILADEVSTAHDSGE